MRRYVFLFFIVILIACLTQIASDIYAPALTSIAIDLQARLDSVQWSMAIYMVSLALAQLVYGPIAEGVGRKAPLIIGLIFMLIGSIVSAIAFNEQMLIVGRIVQGFGAGAAAALWRTIFRDVFSGEELSKYTSYLVVFIIFVVSAAPILGSYLQQFFGWRSCFVFMALYSLMTLGVIGNGFKETSRHHHKERLKASYIIKTYKQLLISRLFMGITLCTFLSYGAFFSWFVVGPVLIVNGLNMTPVQYGWVSFLSAALSHSLGAYVNSKMVKRCGMPNMMRIGWCIMLIGGGAVLIAEQLVGFTLLALMIPVTFFYFGTTLLWPNAFATAFTPFGKIAGYAGALYGAMQLGGGGIIGSIISYLPHSSPLSLGVVMVVSSALAWIAYETIASKQKVESD